MQMSTFVSVITVVCLTSLRLTVNPQAVLKNIISNNLQKETLKKIDVVGDKILEEIRGLRKSMGEYFLALAVYDERVAIEDMEWSIVCSVIFRKF